MRQIIVALAILAMACGDGGGPSESKVEGRWEFFLTLDSSGGGSCSFERVPMRLQEDGDRFQGDYGPADLVCSGPGGTSSQRISGTVINGRISGESVEFYLDDGRTRHTGSLDDDGNMNGTAAWSLEGLTLTGVWSASRN